jgi:ribonuclease R
MFKDFPFLHRIHPEPSVEDIEKLQWILHLFWIKFSFEKFTTKEYQKLLELIEKSPNKAILEKSVLRSLTKAVYSPDNEGHFGLGLDYYSHFTSPIRRYPDLQIHRIIKEKISWNLDKKRINHYRNILKNIALHCSDRERAAEQLEYKVKDYFICKYYRDKIWKQYSWMISWLIPKWFFVMLEDTSEWFVDLTQNKNFIYNEQLMQFEDKINNKIYKIWDKIDVKLIEVDMKLLRLNFDIIRFCFK